MRIETLKRGENLTEEKDTNISMARINLEPGIYTNIFLTTIPEMPACFMVTPRTSFQDLRPLREEIQIMGWNIQVYAPHSSDKVYGYGPNKDLLKNKGFCEEHTILADIPPLTTRLIAEGMFNFLSARGYEVHFGKGRMKAFPTNQFKSAAGDKVRIYQGYDLKSIFWWDPSLEKLAFGLVVDATWAIRDSQGKTLNMHQVAELKAVTQIAQIQGEYLPGGARINTEVARQRFQEQILPFAQKTAEFELPCGGIAKLSSQPIRVIMGGSEE